MSLPGTENWGFQTGQVANGTTLPGREEGWSGYFRSKSTHREIWPIENNSSRVKRKQRNQSLETEEPQKDRMFLNPKASQVQVLALCEIQPLYLRPSTSVTNRCMFSVKPLLLLPCN